jgi:hypothetical protein
MERRLAPLVGVLRMLLAFGLLASLPACATVVAGTTQDLAIDTEPSGASCDLKRGAALMATVPSTPAKVNVSRARSVDAIHLTCRKEGVGAAAATLASRFNGATVGNVIAGGLIGVLVDAASGANYDYPSRTLLVLVPPSFDSEAARDAYFTTAVQSIRDKAARDVKAVNDECRSSALAEACRLDIKSIEEARDKTLAHLESRRSAAVIAPASPGVTSRS